MAAVGCVLSEDQLLCSICLEVFTDPVTTPCGHSFCKTCINKHWDHSPQSHCPVCKESFSLRPQLKLNTCLSEMVTQFKNKNQDEAVLVSEPQWAEAEVFCDVCSDPKLKALKSCLVCLLSYCQNHLGPHVTVPRLKKHQLIQAQNLEDRICPGHDRPLELFCRDDQQFICVQCSYEKHRGHNTVPLKEECEVKQAEIKDMMIMITKRREKVEEVQRLVEVSQKHADREIKEGVRVFNHLMKIIEQSLEQLKQSIEERQKKTEEEATELIEKIQTEVCSLEQRRAEMERLWRNEDHLYFLQTITSVKPVPSLQDWTQVTVKEPSYEGTVEKALSELKSKLDIKNVPFKLKQQCFVDVTLDPDTAYPWLVLSEDLTQVYDTDEKLNLPDNPERFSQKLYVLGKQKFSSGRFYFEVQVKGKTGWVIGVAKESINRKIKCNPTTEDGCWYISKRNGVDDDGSDDEEEEEEDGDDDEDEYDFNVDDDEDEDYNVDEDEEEEEEADDGYKTSDNLYIDVPPDFSPEKVGVFVDYEEGVVSFYDVDSAKTIYSFTNCCFTENLLPLFSPGDNDADTNSAPLTLTLVAK